MTEHVDVGHVEATGSAERRRRDADRSKDAILDAAEEIFARKGFDGASLTEIGAAAGFSATLPTYFFSDKGELYESVVQRLFIERDKILGSLVEQTKNELDGSREGVRNGLACLIGGYLAFLLQHPTFVSLMARDALDKERIGRAKLPRHSTTFEEGVYEFVHVVSQTAGVTLDIDQLLISIVALCFFPLEHDSTMLAGMGYRAWTDGFVERRTRHIVDMLMRVLIPVDAWE